MRHKQICRKLNVGHGDMQFRCESHTDQKIDSKEQFERAERLLNEGYKRFFELFEESSFQGSQAAARKMKKHAKRQTKVNQYCLLFHSLRFLIRSDLKMLSWPNSPLLVILQLVDPNVLCGDSGMPLEEGETGETMLGDLADMADPFDYSTHENSSY
jgi:hypothetical protein